jgi:isoamylase
MVKAIAANGILSVSELQYYTKQGYALVAATGDDFLERSYSGYGGPNPCPSGAEPFEFSLIPIVSLWGTAWERTDAMGYELKHATSKRLLPGRYYPLGATIEPGGVNFALYSERASEVYLLLFSNEDGLPTDIIRLEHKTKNIWHTFVEGLKAGQMYGYKVRGEFNPALGLRFNECKLLLDPYAKAFTGKCRNKDNLLLPYDPTANPRGFVADTRDNTGIMPKCLVIDDRFDWDGDEPMHLPMEKLVIYEVHVKGFTAHASSHVSRPGTYLGFIEKIPHLANLGVNAVEFLPVHEFYVDDFLLERGLTNYWGYNSIGFFAPEGSYGTGRFPGCQVEEFKTLVRALHQAGIAVILDVVYNHTGEGNEFGPVLSFKGIDNPSYYTLTGTKLQPYAYYMNYTGCGNSLNLASAPALRMVMDSLRYWVEMMHVDGFRFDLASVLGRSGDSMSYRRSASFFDAISQDPILNRIMLIAEPWDLGTYEVGNFPIDWSEWNGRFRDTMRRFGKGDADQVRDLGWRLTGSADLYGEDGRSAYNSVNFITCHDGFTLYDLVSYNNKHNDLNGEYNQDGANDNNSWNCGVEGETDNHEVLKLRKQRIKNYACCLLFASGTPMILGGDEFLRTQRGNNNAYCQDGDISWFNWQEAARNRETTDFFRKAIALTRRYTILQRRKFDLGIDLNADHIPDLSWFGPVLKPPNWQDPELRTVCMMLDGGEEPSEAGRYFLYVIFHADCRLQPVAIPPAPGETKWHRVIDTSLPAGEDFREPGREILLRPADQYLVNPRSTVVLLGI